MASDRKVGLFHREWKRGTQKKEGNTFLVPVSIIETVISKISFSFRNITPQYSIPISRTSYIINHTLPSRTIARMHTVIFNTALIFKPLQTRPSIRQPPLRPFRNFAQMTNRSITVSSNNSTAGAVDTPSANTLAQTESNASSRVEGGDKRRKYFGGRYLGGA